jgi:hypothetical protein
VIDAMEQGLLRLFSRNRAMNEIETRLREIENKFPTPPGNYQSWLNPSVDTEAYTSIKRLIAALRVAWEDGRRFMEHDDAKQFDHEVLEALRGEKG